MWNLSSHGDRTAVLTEQGDALSYADLLNAADALAQQIPARCLTFNLCANQFGSLLGYVAFLNHRIVPFMIEAGIDRQFLEALLESYRPDYLWCPADVAQDFDRCEQVYSAFGYVLLKTGSTSAYTLNEDLALLLATSGSTGSPKAVRQSYRNVKANTDSIVEYLGLAASERPISTLPMSYSYGLSILNSHLAVGASTILTKKTLMHREFWQQFKDHKATSIGGVPYTYEMLDKLRFFRMELPSLRTMTQAGGKLSPKLHLKFAEHAAEKGLNFVVMYGQTEATARMSYLPAQKAIEKCGSVGVAIPGGQFSLIDVDGKQIQGSEEVGELVYEGGNVTLGYSEFGGDLAKGDERNGVLATGDLAKRDADGFYYIVGRNKRFLKVFGNRINLDEVETMLRSEYSDLDCACAGRDDELMVFLTSGEKQEGVKKFLAEKTGIHFSGFKIQIIQQIPRNDFGKITYNELAQFIS